MQGQTVVQSTTNKITTSSGTRNQVTSFKVDGLDELIEDFAKLGEDAILQLSEPSIKAANVVLRKAKLKLEPHYKTGDLFHSLKVKEPGKQTNKKAYQVFAQVGFSQKTMNSGGGNGYYGAALELGHRLVFFGKKTLRTVKAVPFLRPAADESKDEVVNIMADAMNKILEDWGSK